MNEDDLISRQAAIDAMSTQFEDIRLTWKRKAKKGEIAMYLDMRGVIETLPSVKIDTEWFPFTRIEPTEEEQDKNPEICYYLVGNLPEDDEKVLVSDGHSVWIDVFDADDASLDWYGEIEIGMAWMPIPKPYKKE